MFKHQNVYVIRARTYSGEGQLPDANFGVPPREFDKALEKQEANVLNLARESHAHFQNISHRRDQFKEADAIIFSPQNFSFTSDIKSGTSWQETDIGREDAWMVIYSAKAVPIYAAEIDVSRPSNPQLEFRPVERREVEGLMRRIEERKQQEYITGKVTEPTGMAEGERGFKDYREGFTTESVAHVRRAAKAALLGERSTAGGPPRVGGQSIVG